jgi:hypothetical protein
MIAVAAGEENQPAANSGPEVERQKGEDDVEMSDQLAISTTLPGRSSCKAGTVMQQR